MCCIEMAKKLHYFDVNGIAESIRYILHYGKQKFEDIRYEHNIWPIKTVKDSLPYGQLPLYEEGNRTLNQSIAIARYVASQHNLLPADPWEQAKLDAVVLNIYDFWYKVLNYIVEKDPVRKQEIKKEILKESVDFFYSRFEKELQANKGFFWKELSWADFILVGVTEAACVFLGEEIHKKYPAIDALIQKITALPGVKEYIAKREPYTF